MKPHKLNGHRRTVPERVFECPLCGELVPLPPTADKVVRWSCRNGHGGKVNLGWRS